MRSKTKRTFRERAMRLVLDEREDFLTQLDTTDRFYKVREGIDQLDTKKLNPHRVQMYSIEEIWKAILARLVKLDVLRDPDDDSEGEDSDSTDLEDEFDFIPKAEKRVGRLFKAKRNKKGKNPPLIDQMKQNDY
jgi:hypothetical protein